MIVPEANKNGVALRFSDRFDPVPDAAREAYGRDYQGLPILPRLRIRFVIAAGLARGSRRQAYAWAIRLIDRELARDAAQHLTPHEQRHGCIGIGGDHMGWPFRYFCRDRWGWVLMLAHGTGAEPDALEIDEIATAWTRHFPHECTAEDAL